MVNSAQPYQLGISLRLPEMHDVSLQLNDRSQDACRSGAFEDVAASYLQRARRIIPSFSKTKMFD